MSPTFFKDQSQLRKWFAKNHDKANELLVGFHKVKTGNPSITWSESVDVAICYGWIDGIRKSRDDLSYTIRFTPRKPTSIWSAVNIKKVEQLTKAGLMQPAGIEAFNRKNDERSKVYSFEQKVIELAGNYEKIFKRNKKAWLFFQSQVPSYRKPAIHWIMTAKKEETRLKRLHILISDSEAGQKIAPLRR